MKYAVLICIHFAMLLTFSMLSIGIINRTKAKWAGRKGPPLWQSFYDIKKLFFKKQVYSHFSSWIFRLGAIIVAVSTLIASALSPILPQFSPLTFDYDFIVFAYVLGLSRLFLVLSAMDTGSSFEGMGASREMSFATLLEPAFFIFIGALSVLVGKSSLGKLSLMFQEFSLFDQLILKIFLVAILLIIAQAESSRMPIDDPTTHLELTMIHEVMILDHSGQELALLNFTTGLKLTIWFGLIASLLNPFSIENTPFLAIACAVGILILLAVLIGLIESTIARLRLAYVPYYILGATVLGTVLLLILRWQHNPFKI